jgi:hypothetical protein
MKLDRLEELEETDETSMRQPMTSADEIGSPDLSARSLIVILLGILPR